MLYMDKHLSVSVSRESPRFLSDLNGSPYSGRGNGNPEDGAAVTMQKAYRGYRARRQLADCAIIARRYGWWNVLEGAILRQNSEQFYSDKQQNAAAARWTRLKTKAAKLGRGLSKDANARKLALQHWLEAIDARHRYGHNLHYYYDIWRDSPTKEPFFYWLDVGQGRDVDLPECPRSKLFKEQIAYLGPKERKLYEISVRDGRVLYKKYGRLLDTEEGGKWIFVMSATGKIYVGQKQKGKFQHSSFLAGGAAKAAGRLSVKNGILESVEPHSGHYRPTEENFRSFLNELERRGIDLTTVKVEFVSEEMRMKSQKSISEEGRANGSYKVEESAANVANGHCANLLTGTSDIVAAIMERDEGANSRGEELPDSVDPHAVVPEANAKPVVESELVGEAISKSGLASKARPPKLMIKRQSSFAWCSGAGARLSSLSVIPADVRTRALEVVQTPRAQATVLWDFTWIIRFLGLDFKLGA